jgi:hypothetical protein
MPENHTCQKWIDPEREGQIIRSNGTVTPKRLFKRTDGMIMVYYLSGAGALILLKIICGG